MSLLITFPEMPVFTSCFYQIPPVSTYSLKNNEKRGGCDAEYFFGVGGGLAGPLCSCLVWGQFIGQAELAHGHAKAPSWRFYRPPNVLARRGELSAKEARPGGAMGLP